jgi:vacuolar protein sorting-associated protein 13A/C
LVDKEAVREIHLKRNSRYSEEDYKRLESLMYDKMSLRLEAAQVRMVILFPSSGSLTFMQFVIGNDLQSCREALTSNAGDNLHLLERINIELQVANSIVPTAYSLARFKVAGKLPSLKANLSDTKYKSLMRLIDACIPKFDDGKSVVSVPPADGSTSSAFQGLFGQKGVDYTVDINEEHGEEHDDTSKPYKESFFEADEGHVEVGKILTYTTPRRNLHYVKRHRLRQHIFELNFQVDNLQASLSKHGNNGEKPLGDVTFDHFALTFAMAKYDMNVDVNLRYRSLSLDLGSLLIMTHVDQSP